MCLCEKSRQMFFPCLVLTARPLFLFWLFNFVIILMIGYIICIKPMITCQFDHWLCMRGSMRAQLFCTNEEIALNCVSCTVNWDDKCWQLVLQCHRWISGSECPCLLIFSNSYNTFYSTAGWLTNRSVLLACQVKTG